MTGIYVPFGQRLRSTYMAGWVEDGSGCWVWVGRSTKKGYGSFRHGSGRTIGAHRAVYLAMKGPVPDGHQLHHVCMNKKCVNPDHLVPLTAEEHAKEPDSAPSLKRARTHCPRGHELSMENIKLGRFRRMGLRQCRICINAAYHNRRVK